MADILELFEVVEEAPEPKEEAPLPEDPRARFEELLRRRADTPWPSAVDAQTKLEEELLAELQRRSRRVPRNLRWEKIIEACEGFAEERDAIIARHVEDHEQACNRVREQREHLDQMLAELALKIEVVPSEEWAFADEVSDLDFGTQTAPRWYAHGKAELRALTYQKWGLEVKIREVWVTKAGSRGWMRYEVWVRTDKTDLAVLKYRGGGLTLEEWLVACAARGLNPRVYRPMLSWEVEVPKPLKYVELGETIMVEHVTERFEEVIRETTA